MDLSLREAAQILGINVRTLRGQLARGKILGVKQNGHWVVPRRNLPLTDDQRTVLQERAAHVRNVVEDILPSRIATHTADRRRSLIDLDSFRAASAVLTAMRLDPTNADARVIESLERGMLDLGDGHFAFDLESKVRALRLARSSFAHAVVFLLSRTASPTHDPNSTWLRRLECEVLPSLGGLLKWAEKLGAKR